MIDVDYYGRKSGTHTSVSWIYIIFKYISKNNV